MSPTFLFFVCLFSCFNLYCFAPPPTASTSQVTEKQINKEIVELIEKITEKPSLFYELVEKAEFVGIFSSKMEGRDVKKIFTKTIMDKLSEKENNELWSLIWGILEKYDKILKMLAGFWNDKCKIDNENKQKLGHKNMENPKVLPKIHKDDKHKEKEHEVDSSLTAIAPDEIYDDLYIALQNIKEDHFTPKPCKALMVVEPPKNQSNDDSTLKLPSKEEHQKEHDDTKINSSKADVHKMFKSVFDRFNANYKDHHGTVNECVHPIKEENIEEHHGPLNAYKIPKNLSIDLKPLVIKEGSQKKHLGKKTPEDPCSEGSSSKPSPGKEENQGEQHGIHPPSPHPENTEEENKEDNEWFEVDPDLHLEEFFEEEKKKEVDDDWIEPPNFM
uniref:Uncharacterized protein n=1 Tax=Meloidogyne enterolobii TaxID=390850 RepID=A0A6V7U1D4_MELEN|nr:unnamed protein product [Meloidogyne enterolobii]